MRIFIETVTPTCRIMKDRSPMGVPRWVVEQTGEDGRYSTTHVYSKLWFSLNRVRELHHSPTPESKDGTFYGYKEKSDNYYPGLDD
jgi:hypothetical protein